MSKRKYRPADSIGVLGAGATLGLIVVLSCELTGHPWWALLMLIVCAAGPAVLRLMLDLKPGSGFQKIPRRYLSGPAKLGTVLLMVGATHAAIWALGINPRDYAYVPLVPPVLLAALFFGFGYAVAAIVLCTASADYFFSLPTYDFRIANIEDLVGLSIFAGLGACLAWAIELALRRHEELNP